MHKEQLIGSWKWKDHNSIMHLHSDGSAVCEGQSQTGQIIRENATWEYVDDTHWKLRLIIPAQPDVPGLEEGAGDVGEYEVISFTPQRMELTKFDYESPFVYERV